MCWYPVAAISTGPEGPSKPSWQIAYQYALSTKGLQEVLCNVQALLEYRIVHLHPVANREGVLGCYYGALYLMSEWIGYRRV
jgi:hypothetical protein